MAAIKTLDRSCCVFGDLRGGVDCQVSAPQRCARWISCTSSTSRSTRASASAIGCFGCCPCSPLAEPTSNVGYSQQYRRLQRPPSTTVSSPSAPVSPPAASRYGARVGSRPEIGVMGKSFSRPQRCTAAEWSSRLTLSGPAVTAGRPPLLSGRGAPSGRRLRRADGGAADRSAPARRDVQTVPRGSAARGIRGSSARHLGSSTAMSGSRAPRQPWPGSSLRSLRPCKLSAGRDIEMPWPL